MNTIDKVLLFTAFVGLPILLALGGLDYPNSLAGSFAKFVFSLH